MCGRGQAATHENSRIVVILPLGSVHGLPGTVLIVHKTITSIRGNSFAQDMNVC